MHKVKLPDKEKKITKGKGGVVMTRVISDFKAYFLSVGLNLMTSTCCLVQEGDRVSVINRLCPSIRRSRSNEKSQKTFEIN